MDFEQQLFRTQGQDLYGLLYTRGGMLYLSHSTSKFGYLKCARYYHDPPKEAPGANQHQQQINSVSSNSLLPTRSINIPGISNNHVMIPDMERIIFLFLFCITAPSQGMEICSILAKPAAIYFSTPIILPGTRPGLFMLSSSDVLEYVCGLMFGNGCAIVIDFGRYSSMVPGKVLM